METIWTPKELEDTKDGSVFGHLKKDAVNTVCLDVAETNPGAKALYQRLGFVSRKIKKGGLKNRYGQGVGHEYMEYQLE